MGEVWRARHRVLLREVAVKVVRPGALGVGPDQDRALLERFTREARAAAVLRSPHSVQTTDFGTTEDGRFYMVMELLEGVDLHQLVLRFGAQPPERAVGLLAQAAEALTEAHGQGLVHRDIKPSNLFVCRLGLQTEFLKVLDYGLVRTAAASELTQSGVLPGSPAFLAPEIIRGNEPTDRADVYALGAVAVWLVTGRLLFEGRTVLEQVAAHLERPAPRLRDLVPEVPEALSALVAACLEKDPAARPPIAEVAAALAQAPPWSGDEWWAAHLPIRGGAATVVRPAGAPALVEDLDLIAIHPADRERAFGLLKQHFEASRIDLIDFERRLDAARVAPTPTHLEAALRGLPAGPPGPGLGAATLAVAPRRAAVETGRILSIVATVKRAGVWEPERRITATSILGEVTLDLRCAELLPGCTTIRCYAMVGSITIIVLPGTFVEVAGWGVLGSFEAAPTGRRPPGDEPWVRVSGTSVLGAVDVKARPRDP
ncbi:MAG: DUF1707 domain-containing protein [Myxococcales bacterium]|nr:DUF1707 domain-containing protein [Myxococcales bacterium]